MSIEPGTPKLVMPRLIVRGSTLGANRFGGTSIPMEDVAAGGRAAFFSFAGAVCLAASA
jgi:hypothetical protein